MCWQVTTFPVRYILKILLMIQLHKYPIWTLAKFCTVVHLCLKNNGCPCKSWMNIRSTGQNYKPINNKTLFYPTTPCKTNIMRHISGLAPTQNWQLQVYHNSYHRPKMCDCKNIFYPKAAPISSLLKKNSNYFNRQQVMCLTLRFITQS